MKKIYLLACLLTVSSIGVTAQELSKFSFTLGYGTVFNNPAFTTGNTQTRMLIQSSDNRNQYLSLNAGVSHALNFQGDWQLGKGFGLIFRYKQLIRRYYFWSGSYEGADARYGEDNSYNIVPSAGFLGVPAKDFGFYLRTASWQIGPTFKHSIGKSGKWGMKYCLTMNIDNHYRLNVYQTMTTHNFSIGSNFEDGSSYLVDGKYRSEMNAAQGGTPLSVSFNYDVMASYRFSNQLSFNAGLSFRDVRNSSNGFTGSFYVIDGVIEERNNEGTVVNEESFRENMSIITGGLVVQFSATYNFMKRQK